MAHARKKRSGKPRGGYRPNSGRKQGSTNFDTDVKNRKLLSLTKEFTEEAIDTIVFHMRNKRKTPELSERAAEYLVNRIYGTPKQAIKLGLLNPEEDGGNEDIEFTMTFNRRVDAKEKK